MTTNFQKLVSQSNKSLKQISYETGIGYSTLGNYNQGTRTPKAKNARILADYFNVSIAYILGLDGPEAEHQKKDNTESIEDTLSNMAKMFGDDYFKVFEQLEEVYKFQFIKSPKRDRLNQIETQKEELEIKIKELQNEVQKLESEQKQIRKEISEEIKQKVLKKSDN